MKNKKVKVLTCDGIVYCGHCDLDDHEGVVELEEKLAYYRRNYLGYYGIATVLERNVLRLIEEPLKNIDNARMYGSLTIRKLK